MGVPGKWIKALVGLKKSERPQSSKKDENGTATSKSRHGRNSSVEIDGDLVHNEIDQNTAASPEDANSCLISDTTESPSLSLQGQNVAHNEPAVREEWAVTHIQTAFRGFLARRALWALKGVVRLQALIRGHSVRKQAAITLHCMQALVRVQAHVRARRVRLALESQTTQQKLRQKLAGEEEGWCDSIGSVEQIQAKLLKRQEAAAKRERAMAYALSHQWQAGSRQQAAPSAFEPDKSSWGWNWLERWMAVRPWENRFLVINLRDGLMIRENGSAEATKNESQLKSNSKKQIASSVRSNLLSQKVGPSHSDGSNSSSGKSAGMLDASSIHFGKAKPKPLSEELVEEAGSASRSQSNPKERTAQPDKQKKKRLSLPNSGHPRTRTAGNARTSARCIIGSHEPLNDKSKYGEKVDSKSTKFVPLAVDP